MAGLSNTIVQALWHDNTFGLEIEQHRINGQARLSRHPYPSEFGSRKTHPYLQSDFTDTMMELVTEPAHSTKQVLENMRVVQQVLYDHLKPDESIWPFSMPPKLVEDDLQFAHENFTRDWYQDYRDHLEEKYGIYHEIICGTHINFSLNPQLIETLFSEGDTKDHIYFVNHLYFKMGQWFVLYRWLFTYLYGATPLSENGYQRIPSNLSVPVRSLRNSSLGYSNKQTELVTYDSLEKQVQQIENYVDQQIFYTQHEFYGPVRLKGEDDLRSLINSGVQYLEFRSFDLNPLTEVGVDQTLLDFMELFLTFAAVNDLPQSIENRLQDAIQKNEEVALQAPDQQPKWLTEASDQLLKQLHKFINDTNADEHYQQVLNTIKQRIQDVTKTVGAEVAVNIQDQSLIKFGQTIAQERKAWYLPNAGLSFLANRYDDQQRKGLYRDIITGKQVKITGAD